TEKGSLAGFIAGEVRAWEFGQPAAGWVFAIQIESRLRLKGVGTALFEALVARFKAQGVTRVRTLADRKAHLSLSFFRAQRLVAGPSLQLDMDLARSGSRAHGWVSTRCSSWRARPSARCRPASLVNASGCRPIILPRCCARWAPPAWSRPSAGRGAAIVSS